MERTGKVRKNEGQIYAFKWYGEGGKLIAVEKIVYLTTPTITELEHDLDELTFDFIEVTKYELGVAPIITKVDWEEEIQE